MEMLALTCPQCGSAAVKLVPERNDLAQCNYCSSIFMLPPPIIEEAKPKITALDGAEEEVDMTEVVYPIKPTLPSGSGYEFFIPWGLISGGVLGGVHEIAKWKPDHQQLIMWGVLVAIGILVLFILLGYWDKVEKEFQDSEEMQTYIQACKAADDKTMAQIRYRERQQKRSNQDTRTSSEKL